MINAMKKHLDELKWPAPRTISKMQVRRPCPPAFSRSLADASSVAQDAVFCF